MAIRTFNQYGVAYGTTPTSIVVLLDGVEIYSGSVPTVDIPITYSPYDNILFSWGQEASYSTPRTVEISVTGSLLVVAQTLGTRLDPTDITKFVPPGYHQVINGTTVLDPYTDITINGVPSTRLATPTGQWFWKVPPDTTFKATFNCLPGIDYPEWDSQTDYPVASLVVYQNAAYQASQEIAPTVGVPPPDDRRVWIPLKVKPWDINQAYILNDRVLFNGAYYRAAKDVPPGIDIHNLEYWAFF